jgi:hypothetical protein
LDPSPAARPVVYKTGVSKGDLQPKIAAFLPINREEAVELGHTGGALLDRRMRAAPARRLHVRVVVRKEQ